MKKNTLLLALVSILLISCSKKTETPIDSTPKKIERIMISPEYLLPIKSKDIFIGIRYFKDYTDKDLVTVTLNNQSGVIVSEEVGTIDGTNLLFKLPAIVQLGDYRIKCSVKNDQNSLETEQIFRIVNDYSINTVWNNLDKNYSSSFASYADRLRTNGYTLRPIINTATQVQFGSYFENQGNLNQYASRSFIPALPGLYTLIYNDLGLQQIKINNGSPDVDQNFSTTKFYADVTANYGNYISQNNTGSGKVTVFKSGAYTLTVTETPALVSTSITKS